MSITCAEFVCFKCMAPHLNFLLDNKVVVFVFVFVFVYPQMKIITRLQAVQKCVPSNQPINQ